MGWKACKIGKVRKIFRQTGICGGKPDERKELSNSLRNDSLLSKRIKPGYNYSCFSAGIGCGSSIV